MSDVVNKSTRAICQGFTCSQRTFHYEHFFAADNLSDAAQKIVKAVKG
jgi:hypothetical protein